MQSSEFLNDFDLNTTLNDQMQDFMKFNAI